MNRSACLAAVAAISVLAVAPMARAASDTSPAPEQRLGSRRVAGETVVPRSFRFDELPLMPPDESRPVTVRQRGLSPELQAQVDAAKAAPPLLSVSDASAFTLDSTPAGSRGKGSLAALAPTAGNGFEGITQNGFIPAAPAVGAGPLNVLSCGNVTVTITNKNGTGRSEVGGISFFGVDPAEGDIFSPECYYDALRGRFVALCYTQGTLPTNYSFFYLAISKTNDARGAWWLYKFDMTKDNATQTSNWSEYQGLGLSDDKLVMSAQQMTFAGNAYQYQKLRVLDRALAYSGAALSPKDIVNFAPPPGGDVNDNMVTKPARNLTPGDNTVHCLCVRIVSGARVTYRALTGPPSAPVLSTGNLIPVTAYSAPPDAAQSGSATLVVTGDCRPADFYVRNGVLAMAFHSAANIGGSNVSAIHLLRIRTSDHTLLTDELYGQANTFYYYPAVVADSVGTLFMGFDRSSATEFPSAYATGKRRNDATIQPSTLLKAGLTSTIQTRWGDYTGIDQDASQFSPGQTVAWYAGQWNKGPNNFGTWVNKLSYTFGQVFGTVSDDCDGSIATPADRTPVAGVTVTLKQGATTVATTTTNALGQYSFGYLESGTYDAVVTAPVGGTIVDAVAGAGGTTQTRISSSDVRVAMTDAQSSLANDFVVTATRPLATTGSIAPSVGTTGAPQFSLTVNGSNFTGCSVVRVDGSDRATTFVSPTQLSATITAADQSAAGSKAITVFTPAPGGGTSNSQTLIINDPPDVTPPVIALTSPNGADILNVGNSSAITWNASDNKAVTAIDLELSRNGAAGPYESIATGLANTGTFSWLATLPATTHAMIRATAHDAAGHTTQDWSDAEFAIAGGAGVDDAPVTAFALSPVSPNPVRRSTRFQFALPQHASVHLSVLDVQGRELLVLADGTYAPGRHSVSWSSIPGSKLGPGLYFVRMTVPGRTLMQRFVLMK